MLLTIPTVKDEARCRHADQYGRQIGAIRHLQFSYVSMIAAGFQPFGVRHLLKGRLHPPGSTRFIHLAYLMLFRFRALDSRRIVVKNLL